MRRLPTFPVGVLVLLALAALARVSTAEDAPPHVLPAFGWVGIDGVDALAPASRDPQRLAALGDVKGLLVRTRPIRWESIQPRAPISGRSLRDFEALDAFVAAWQRIGAEPILVVSPEAAWAASGAETSAWARDVREGAPEAERELWLAEGRGATPPLPARWDDWQRFVQALVERYDADGQQDAAGVRRPVQWVQILDRPASPTGWTGSAAEYQRALHHATLGAEMASSAVRVAAGAVDVGRDAYPPEPDEAGLRRRFAERMRDLPAGVAFAETRALDFDLEVLAIPGIYAAVGHVGRKNLRDEVAGPRFLRGQLAREGVSAEVWLVDSALAKMDDPARDPTGRMSDAERRLRARWLAAVRVPARGGTYEAARSWYERGRRHDVARTVAAARAAGVDRLLLGGASGLDAWVPATAEGGWQRRPCADALAQALDLLTGHTHATERRLGRTASATTFHFPRGHAVGRVVLVTLDPRHCWARGSGVEAKTWATAIPLTPGRYRLETLSADGERQARMVRADGGLLPLTLGPEPVYLVPSP